MKTIAGVGCLAVVFGASDSHTGSGALTCGDLKEHYRDHQCCGQPEKSAGKFQLVPSPTTSFAVSANPCNGTKPTKAKWMNAACFEDDNTDVSISVPQAGADVTDGTTGSMEVTYTPYAQPYYKSAMCPVNVHWHLGAEHKSDGEYDKDGKSPEHAGEPMTGGALRYGFACHLYDKNDVKFTTEYDWKHCKDMHVGETYEVHWPHSALGMCNTPWQYQEPFYDGVFCNFDEEGDHANLQSQDVADAIGVQGQVFTVVNDEQYYYPNLMWGMIVDGEKGKHVTKYTGSTTGTSRSNTMCSNFGPITWQVDRKCHLISASSFDKMCADMKQQRDDLSGDLHPHGARELVDSKLAANNGEHRV